MGDKAGQQVRLFLFVLAVLHVAKELLSCWEINVAAMPVLAYILFKIFSLYKNL